MVKKNSNIPSVLRSVDVEDVLLMIHEDLLLLAGVGAKSGSLRRYETSNILELDGSVIDALRCGDQVLKLTGNQRHLYTVTYKGEGVGEGICLTYMDASVVETVSYDHTESGWVYNSTDKSTLVAD